MTTRETKIIKAVLNYLHALDYGQAAELEIHAYAFGGAFGGPRPSVAELAAALAHCDANRWIVGVKPRIAKGLKWNIADAGEAARLEM